MIAPKVRFSSDVNKVVAVEHGQYQLCNSIKGARFTGQLMLTC